MNSDKYIFKKKLNSRRKSKRRLFIESFFMLTSSFFLAYIFYVIPNKNLLLQNFFISLNDSFLLLNDLFINLFQISVVLFILALPVVIFIFLLGSLMRFIRIAKRKNKMLNFE